MYGNFVYIVFYILWIINIVLISPLTTWLSRVVDLI